ncbi:FRG domain-containing protein [Leptospira ilyithenensis]|uniref:FRG domain-containing protein n=1 Tax=Leptospira ilyithenensis TaxID=2484901 RepID=A0A4R9LIV9_9LEPT|nr:FRG domain-containing protein [Leptospira ilyithenensis]TGN06797.1 FRG domain-containing protein [Leptospira ilyithenensis]
MIKEETITTESELIKKLNELEKLTDLWVFRGEANSDWKLNTTIDRISQSIGLFPFSEQESIFHVIRTKRIYDELRDINSENYLEILSFLQHHGVPTRLLDFTKSPYIALYFAFEDLSPNSDFASIYGFQPSFFRMKLYDCINRQKEKIKSKIEPKSYQSEFINWGHIDNFQKLYNEILQSDAINLVLPVEPDIFNKRIFIQQGLFFLQGNSNLSFIENLEIYYPSDIEQNTFKINISRNLQKSIILKLANMGITPYSLYPGLEGLMKDMKLNLYRNHYKIFGTE